MNSTIIIINLFALACLIAASIKDRPKVRQSLAVALRSLLRIAPTILIIIVLIGILWSFLPPDKISDIVGEQSGLDGVLLVAVLGAIVHIPALLSFPLAASFLEQGASITAVAAFITTLTMIGTVTLPLEIKELGREMALLRNGISFIIAIIIALLMGMVL
jgi:uncharacterized membrane protein YraQ (UPF0718 family)